MYLDSASSTTVIIILFQFAYFWRCIDVRHSEEHLNSCRSRSHHEESQGLGRWIVFTKALYRFYCYFELRSLFLKDNLSHNHQIL